MDSRVKDINLLLNIGLDDVRMIGIYSLGGIGKTTLAKAVYNLIFLQFEGSCFLANVREKAGQLNGPIQLQEQLLSELLGIKNLKIGSVDRGINLIKERLNFKRVLIVLDDLDQLSQLDSLARNHDWFGLGSRIIITTRDEHLLKGLKDDERYMAKELNQVESLQLFNWHAFREINPLKKYTKLSNDIVSYAGGFPLALEVLGSSLFGRDMPQWKSAFQKLQQIPHNKIQEKLRISFDALDDDKMKDIFLDIACFFIGTDKEYAITILDSCGFFLEIGIDVLISRCLLRINKKNKLIMHDLLLDMGREIILQESCKEPEKRTRLWFHEDVCNLLGKNKGTESVEGIILVLPILKDIQLSTKAFSSMTNLRLLQINHVHLSGNFEHLFEELRWLCWHNCPLEYLPSNLHLENLVALDMQFSRIKTFWQDGKYFKSLKILNLSDSKCLTKTPHFSAVPRLEKLLFERCTNLIELHESIGLLDRLVYLSLKDCMNLRYLPNSICKLKSIEHLNLSGCSKLEELPEHLGHMESLTELLANGTAIKQLPFSIGLLKNLVILSLKGCNRRLPTKSWISLISSWVSSTKNSDCIRFLPSSVSNLHSVTELNLSDCNLSEGDFPDGFGSLSSLRELDLSINNFRSLPCCLNHLSKLEFLTLGSCTSLQSISNLPPKLWHINLDNCESLEKISNLSKLRRLELWYYVGPTIYDTVLQQSDILLLPSNSAEFLSIRLYDDFELPQKSIEFSWRRVNFYRGSELPCRFILQVTRSSSLSFDVPTHPVDSKRIVPGIEFGVVFTAGPDGSSTQSPAAYTIAISNKTRGLEWTYTSTIYNIPVALEDYVLLTYIPHEDFGFPIESGDQLEASFVIPSAIEVKKCGIHVRYRIR